MVQWPSWVFSGPMVQRQGFASPRGQASSRLCAWFWGEGGQAPPCSSQVRGKGCRASNLRGGWGPLPTADLGDAAARPQNRTPHEAARRLCVVRCPTGTVTLPRGPMQGLRRDIKAGVTWLGPPSKPTQLRSGNGTGGQATPAACTPGRGSPRDGAAVPRTLLVSFLEKGQCREQPWSSGGAAGLLAGPPGTTQVTRQLSTWPHCGRNVGQ